MRSKYIVAYDIGDDKRLRKVFLKMRGFGDPLQYSVFLCELSAREKAIMISELEVIINHKDDSIMIVNLGTADHEPMDRIELMGRTPPVPERKALVI